MAYKFKLIYNKRSKANIINIIYISKVALFQCCICTTKTVYIPTPIHVILHGN